MSRKLRSETRWRGRLLSGAAAGAAAYVAGYVLTFLLMRGEARNAFGDAVPVWKVVGWYFYNAHFVDIVSGRSAGPFEDAAYVSLIAESSGSTATFLYAVPPLALLAAGAVVAWRLDGDGPAGAAAGGAAAVLGYGPLAVAGALVLPHAAEGSFLGVDVSATITVPLASAVILAGLVYPVILVTVGAVLGATVRRDGARGEPASG